MNVKMLLIIYERVLEGSYNWKPGSEHIAGHASRRSSTVKSSLQRYRRFTEGVSLHEPHNAHRDQIA